LLLAKDDTKHMLLHYASLLRIIQILERLWNWAKEQLTPQKLNILTANRMNLAASKVKLDVLGKEWECTD